MSDLARLAPRPVVGWLSVWALFSAACFCASNADAAPLGGAHPVQIPLLRLFAAFAICALAALVIALAVKNFWGRGKAGPIGFKIPSFVQAKASHLTVLETRALGLNAQLSRVVYGDLELLILVSAQGASLLHQKPAEKDAAPASEPRS